MFALHGLVDVSGHRIGTAFAGIFLLGMALRRPLDLHASRVTPVVFRLLGLLFLVCGVAWLAATRYEMLLPGALGAENAKQSALRANRGQNFVETVALTDRALGWAPLDWELYFLRALGKIGRKWPSDAVDDFRRARYLEPNAIDLPFQEGIAWMPTRPILAVTAWREALRRAGPQRAELYAAMLRTAKDYPAVIRGLERVSPGQPDLVLVFLESAQGEVFDDAVQRFIVSDPDLKTLSPEERERFFSLWADRGNLETLEQIVAKRPNWLPFAWEGLAKLHCPQERFPRCLRVSAKFAAPPTLPQSFGACSDRAAAKKFLFQPKRLRRRLRALPGTNAAGQKIDDALGTVRHFADIEGRPSYFFFLEAQTWAAKENWERAWKSWQAFQTVRKENAMIGAESVARRAALPTGTFAILCLLALGTRVAAAFVFPNPEQDGYSYVETIARLSASLSAGTFRAADLFDFWLPLYQFAAAIANLWVHNPLLVGKILSAGCGAASCVLVFGVVWELTQNRSIAWLSFGLVLCNPLHILYSAASMTDVPHACFILGSLYAALRRRWVAAAIWMAIAEGIRIEAWVFVLVLPLLQLAYERRVSLFVLLILILPPLCSIGICQLATGNPFAIFERRQFYIQSYLDFVPSRRGFTSDDIQRDLDYYSLGANAGDPVRGLRRRGFDYPAVDSARKDPAHPWDGGGLLLCLARISSCRLRDKTSAGALSTLWAAFLRPRDSFSGVDAG